MTGEELKYDAVPTIVNYLYVTAGISDPTEQDNRLAMEAIVYANIDYWVDNPITLKEFYGKKMFVIKLLSCFMRKRNSTNMEVVRYFEEYEHREIAHLGFV